MKALTIKQPWAFLIADGKKSVENRTWATKYRGRIAIHVSKAPIPRWVRTSALRSYIDFMNEQRGRIICTTVLKDCVKLEDAPPAVIAHPYTEGPVCWLLEDVRRFPSTPVIKGVLGLWEWAGR